MARCAMRSGNAVVKCAHSAPAQTDFGFTCSVPFGALHFFGFLPLPARKCLWEPVSERAVENRHIRVLNGLPDRRTDFFVLGKVVQQ